MATIEWYYLKTGWFKSTKMGPVSESKFLGLIDAGEITPETLILCETKTRNQWVKMSTVSALQERWENSQNAGTK